MKNHIKVKINVNGHDRVYGGWPDSVILSALNIVSFLCDQVFLSLFVYLDQPAHCMESTFGWSATLCHFASLCDLLDVGMWQLAGHVCVLCQLFYLTRTVHVEKKK